MRHDFCTVVDLAYLPRALVFHRSLVEHCDDFRLHVVAMDDATERLLPRLDLQDVVQHRLRDLEEGDPGLRETKRDRTVPEYCWTAKAPALLRVLDEDPAIETITYADADLALFADPEPLFAEMGGASAQIVPHRFALPYREMERTNGTFNAGWVSFRRDERAHRILEWWRDRCLEWCYGVYEDGKMTDQMYLNDWPSRFGDVNVLEHPGGGLAPWNVSQHSLAESEGRVMVDGWPLVFYHYHSLRLYELTPIGRAASALSGVPRHGGGPLLWTTAFPVSGPERRWIWEPYLRRLHEETGRVHSLEPGVRAGVGRWRLRDSVRRSSSAAVRPIRLARDAVRAGRSKRGAPENRG